MSLCGGKDKITDYMEFRRSVLVAAWAFRGKRSSTVAMIM